MKNARGLLNCFGVTTLIVLFFSVVYAEDTLATEQATKVAVLTVVEEKVVDVFEKIEDKTTNREINTQLADTKEEITALIEKQQAAIEQTQNSQEIAEIMQETKERIILKTYDALTDHDPISDSIAVPGGKREQKQATQAALDQIVESNVITIQIRTYASGEGVKQSFLAYDHISIKELFSSDDIHYFEVSFPKEGIIAQELLENAAEGILPDELLGYQVIKPEVYTIGEINLGSEQIAYLWGLHRFQSPLYIQALSNTTLPIVHVGVIDTGVDPTHPDLSAAISQTIPGYDFVNDDTDPMDDHQHGTHVAGVIAAQANGSGVVGVNPAIKIVPLKICTKTGYCPSYAISNAIRYAADHGIEVLNMSLGGAGTLVNNSTCAAIEYAATHGSIAVVAAGNANTNALGFIPAACPQTITVGAVDNTLKRASFSNYGAEVDISAPGVGIYSTLPGSKRGSLDGTSMATPHISAAVATVHAVAGTMTTAQMQQKLLTHTLPVTFESGKQIGPFLNYPSLMHSLNVGSSPVLCGASPCFGTTAGSGILAVAEQIGTGTTVASDSTPLILNGLTINYSSVGLRVNETLTITIEGGRNGHTFTKGSEKFGIGNRTNTTISTSEGYKAKTTITLLGLQPGDTELIIKDQSTNKEVVLPITITERIVVAKPGHRIALSNGSFWNLGAITFSGSNGHLVKTYDGGGFSQEYTVKKSGIVTMHIAISNKYENKTQYMHYEIRSTADPITTNTQLLSLKVGQYANDIKIGGGSPPYTVKKGSLHVGFWMKSSDITLASAETAPEIIFDDTNTGSIAVSGTAILPCDEDSCEQSNTLDENINIIDLFSPDQSQETGLDIANTIFNFAVLPLTPGLSSVTVIDADGSTLTIPVSIEPADLALKLNNQVGRYRNNSSYNYEIKSVTSSHPGIVAITYISNSQTYIATAKTNGYATLTFSIYNKTEQRNQVMHIQVIAGSTQQLEVTGTKTEIIVGETLELQIKGGMGPYIITKSNEGVALGFGSDTTPISIAGGAFKQAANIQLAQKNDPLPPTTVPTLSSLTYKAPDGATVNLIDAEELSGSDEVYVQGIAPASTPLTVEGVFTVRAMGLQPGVTSITVTDADGSTKQLSITVLPRKITLDAADHKTVLTSWLTYPGRRDLNSIESTTPSVRPWTKRGIVFLKGEYIASGSLSVHLYNRHESKKQTLVYETEVIGPTYEQYLRAIEIALAKARAQASAKVSSITAADLIRAGIDPCYSLSSCNTYNTHTNPGGGSIIEKQIADNKALVDIPVKTYSMNAGQMTVINVTRHDSNTLTLQYDPTQIVIKKYSEGGKIQPIAYISSADTGDTDERLGSEIYEVVDDRTDMYILANGVPDGKILYEQYVLMGKPGNHQVKFSSKYGAVMTTNIFYADKVYTIEKSKTKTSKLNGMPLMSAYEDNSSIVDNRAYFEHKDSNGLPIASSPNDSLTIQGKNYGQTVLHREFQQSPTQLQVLDIKVKVPNPNTPTFSQSLPQQVLQLGEEHGFAFSNAGNYRVYYNPSVVSLEDSGAPSMQYVGTKPMNGCPETYAESIGTTNYIPLKLLSSVSTSICLENKDTGEIMNIPLISSVLADGGICTNGSSNQCLMYPHNLFTVYDNNGSIVAPPPTSLSQNITYFFVHGDTAYRSRIVGVPVAQLSTFFINVGEGAIYGDYQANPNAANIIGQIGYGFTPAGVIGDVRDFSYQWENGTKFDIILAGVAFIPGAGDGVKALWKSGKYGDDILKIAEDYLKLVNRDTIVTHGMVDYKTHYKKHGVKEFLEHGLEPVSAQQYFDDAASFFYNIDLNDSKYIIEFRNTVLGNGKRIKDTTTGKGGIISDSGGIVTFFYF